jgi:hypothetical protein
MFFHYYDNDYINAFRHEYEIYTLQESQRLDITRISVFIEDVKYFLWRLVKHKPAFVDNLYDDVVNAWNASKRHFETAHASIARLLNEGSTQFISRLHDFGLLDSELKLKFRNIEHQFGDLISMNSKKALKKLFACINNVLDCILEALGVHKAIIEIKDAIRDALV